MGSGRSNKRDFALLSALLLPVLATCAGAESPFSGIDEKLCAGGYDPATGTVGELGLEGTAKAKVEVFLKTSASLTKAVTEVETEALGACRSLGKDLGMTDAELAGAPDPNDPGAVVRNVCKAVSAKIKKMIEDNVPKDTSLVVEYTAGRCEVNANAQLNCTQMCETKTYTENEIRCKPGKFSYTCGASCSATCTGSCSAMCTGSCTADCMGECTGEISGTCEGTCDGQCDGTCMGDLSGGKCKGKCMGTCKGTCMGSCSGTCSGSCMGSCNAQCMGNAEPPKCEEVEVVKMKTDCDTTCEAQAKAEARCEAPRLLVEFNSGLQKDPMKKAQIDTLVAALKKNLPVFLKAGLRVENIIKTTVEPYIAAAGRAAIEVKTNLKAAGCVALAGKQSGNDSKKVGGTGAAFGELVASLKAKGQAAITALACEGYDPAMDKKGPSFGTTAAGLKVNALMSASVALVKASNQIETDALTACKAMGTELGIAAGELSGDMKTVCARVKTELDTAIKALAGIKVKVVATPAICTVDASASVKCTETCENKTITETDIMCTPAKLSGSCSASCTGSCKGSCSANVSASCSAVCEGMCEGEISAECSGTCEGTCEGTCMGNTATGAGQCKGTCMGKCQGKCSAAIKGTCSGKCMGKCSATIEGSCMGSCMGSCTGGCSAKLTAPYCEEVEVMRMVTECQRSCDAEAKCSAMCTAPSVDIVVEGAADAKTKAAKVIAALKAGMPNLLKVAKRVKGTVEASADGYVNFVKNAPETLTKLDTKSAGCIAAALSYSGAAALKVKAALQASVEIGVVAGVPM